MDDGQAREVVKQLTRIHQTLYESTWYRLISLIALWAIAIGVLILAFRGIK